jgi:hypothetical protein
MADCQPIAGGQRRPSKVAKHGGVQRPNLWQMSGNKIAALQMTGYRGTAAVASLEYTLDLPAALTL